LLEEKICIPPHPSELDRVIAFTLFALESETSDHAKTEAVSKMCINVRR
jgi:hypothetical protein